MTFRSAADAAIEQEVADTLAVAWACEIRSYGGKDHIDYYAIRDEETVAFMELKARKVPHNKYPTVFLALRKWIALALVTVGTGKPAFYIVRFTDGIRYINVMDVDPKRLSIGGNSRNRAANDIEVMIEVPITALEVL
jgi:hypothetical protein